MHFASYMAELKMRKSVIWKRFEFVTYQDHVTPHDHIRSSLKKDKSLGSPERMTSIEEQSSKESEGWSNGWPSIPFWMLVPMLLCGQQGLCTWTTGQEFGRRFWPSSLSPSSKPLLSVWNESGEKGYFQLLMLHTWGMFTLYGIITVLPLQCERTLSHDGWWFISNNQKLMQIQLASSLHSNLHLNLLLLTLL